MTEPIPPSEYLEPMRTALEAAAEAGRPAMSRWARCCSTPPGQRSPWITTVVRSLSDPTAHAEMLVLSQRARDIGDWRLERPHSGGHPRTVPDVRRGRGAGLASTASCTAAADPKAGAAWSLYNIPQDRRLNHRIDLVEGVLAAESTALLEQFFAARR